MQSTEVLVMDSRTLDNLIETIRECDQNLRFVSDELPSAFNVYTRDSQGGTDLGLAAASEQVIRLRTVVDAITKQFLYRTRSAGFKDRIDESTKRSNWRFPTS
jgi:hypothetical protein